MKYIIKALFSALFRHLGAILFEMKYTNFETPEFRRGNPGEHPVIVSALEKARTIIHENAINPSDFVNLYGSENVQRDLKEVASLKKRFETDETQKASEVFEAIVFEQVELSNWLGDHAETIRTSEFDDIVNGVDLVVEFSEDNSTNHLALGVDVTFGTMSIGKKFDRIRKEIDADNLATVKYFESHGFKGSLRQLPRVVIGVERDTVIALAGLWSRQEKTKLGNHFVKDILIQEIERQLRTYLVYAQSNGATASVKSYTKALGTIKSIRESNPIDTTDKVRHAAIASDRVFKEIIEQLGAFQKPSR